MTAAFDEMEGCDGRVREPYLSVHEWLKTHDLDDLKRKRSEAEALWETGKGDSEKGGTRGG